MLDGNDERRLAAAPSAALPYGMQLLDASLNIALSLLALQPLLERDRDPRRSCYRR